MAKGYRPCGRQKIGYDYGYLSVAVNPVTGELFMLILPDMRAESFQTFVDEFEKFEREEVQQITDGAASHRSKRIELEERVELETLSAYSPQLNPAERFFQEVRRKLKNRVFESYEEVEKAVIEAVKPYLKDKQKVKSITCYGWLLSTPT